MEARLGEREVVVPEALVLLVALVERDEKEVEAAVGDGLHPRVEVPGLPFAAGRRGERGAELEVEVASVDDDGDVGVEKLRPRESVRARGEDGQELPKLVPRALGRDRVVGQGSRYLGWAGEERRGNRESMILRKPGPTLRHAVKADERLSPWEFDEDL
jgi:hypothetical protein